jgi:hypothetical protein
MIEGTGLISAKAHVVSIVMAWHDFDPIGKGGNNDAGTRPRALFIVQRPVVILIFANI